MFDYKISTMTVSASYGNNIFLNLINIGKYLDIDESILGIKYDYGKESILKGSYLTSIYLKSKYKNVNKINTNLFYNQVSIILKLDENNSVNVKLFANGSLHLTGIKDEENIKRAMDLLYDKLCKLRYKKIRILLTRDLNNVYVDNDNIIYSNSEPRYIMGYKMDNDTYVINKKTFKIDPYTKYFISDKMESKRTKMLIDLDGKNVGYTKIELLKNKLKLYKKNSNIHLDKNIINSEQLIYYDGDGYSLVIGKIVYYLQNDILSTYNNNIIEYEYSCNPFREELQGTNYSIDINCINIFFNLDLQINRQRFFNKLVENNYICEYKPEKYSGIKFIYKNNSYNKGICMCSNKCICENITFLIFQSGNIIVSGFKNQSHIKNILNNFENIYEKFKDIIKKRNLI